MQDFLLTIFEAALPTVQDRVTILIIALSLIRSLVNIQHTHLLNKLLAGVDLTSVASCVAKHFFSFDHELFDGR